MESKLLYIVTGIFIIMGMGSLVSKIIYDWLKARNGGEKEKLLICSLDRTGAIDQIRQINEKSSVIKDNLYALTAKIDFDLKASKKSAVFYDAFLKNQMNLNNATAQVLKQVEETNQRLENQGKLMLALTHKLNKKMD